MQTSLILQNQRINEDKSKSLENLTKIREAEINSLRNLQYLYEEEWIKLGKKIESLKGITPKTRNPSQENQTI